MNNECTLTERHGVTSNKYLKHFGNQNMIPTLTHSQSWVLGNDQKHKIVKTSGWCEFPGGQPSLRDKGSRAATPPCPQETRLSIWPGCLLKASRGGVGCFRHVPQGGDPGPDLGEAGEIISVCWSGNALGRSWWEQPGGGLPWWSCYPREPDQEEWTKSKCSNFYSLNPDSCQFWSPDP